MVMPQSKSVTRFGLRQDWSLGDGGDSDEKSAEKDANFVSFVQWIALCSKNFQNVKLRLDSVDILQFYRHSDFT